MCSSFFGLGCAVLFFGLGFCCALLLLLVLLLLRLLLALRVDVVVVVRFRGSWPSEGLSLVFR